MAALLCFIFAAFIICTISFLFLYRHKLNKLQPAAQTCQHIQKLPSITLFIPKFILFSVIKPQRKPLQFCQLIAPHNKTSTKHAQPKRKVVTINAVDPEEKTDDIEAIKVYEYFSQIEVMIDCLSIDPLKLVAYNKLFKSSDFEQISMCYLDAITSSLTSYIVTKDAFPVSPFGLIRIGTEIIMHERLSIAKEYEVTKSLSEMRETPQGIEIDISTIVYVSDSTSNMSRMVYESVDTLRSNNNTQHKSDDKKCNSWNKEFDVNRTENKHNVIAKKAIDIPQNINMKYAKITSDFHLQYLHKLGAMCYGYDDVCVHNMWILDKCLTEIKEENKNKKDSMFIYRYPIKMVASFVAPICVTNKAKLITNYYSQSNDYLTFAVLSEHESVAHILGSIVAE